MKLMELKQIHNLFSLMSTVYGAILRDQLRVHSNGSSFVGLKNARQCARLTGRDIDA